MRIKVEKKLKQFLKKNKAYKKFRKCILQENKIWLEVNPTNAYKKGQSKYCDSILNSFMIESILSQNEKMFWYKLNDDYEYYKEEQFGYDDYDEPIPYWYKQDDVNDPYREENYAREHYY